MEDKFSAFILLLKFDPFMAPLFLAQLFDEFNVRPEKNELKFSNAVTNPCQVHSLLPYLNQSENVFYFLLCWSLIFGVVLIK